ncbi:MAG: ATP-binding protein [candidate division Zixibacteria bacterium]
MYLRSKIFRHLILFALVPSLIIVLVGYYLLDLTIQSSDKIMEDLSPDRTINSMRLVESKLQLIAANLLIENHTGEISNSLDWMVIDSGQTTVVVKSEEFIELPDSIFEFTEISNQFIRKIGDDYIILGASSEIENIKMAGGFIMRTEYLEGFEAATLSLRESRHYRNIQPGLLQFIIYGGLFVFIIVGGAAYFISRRLSALITIPLESLADASRKLSSGEIPGEIEIRGTDEVNNLSWSFKKMIVDLDDNRQKLVAAERMAAWQEFARRMAHELKNPLTPISISLFRLKNKLKDKPEFQDYADSLEAISSEISHLERMANDYSSLAKMPEIDFQVTNFNQLCREVVNLYTGQLESFQFEFKSGAENYYIKGDADRLREVMVNIIKNALEFCAPNGVIIISNGVSGGQIYFEVVNEAVDIDVRDLKSATMPYFTTRPNGTGLGLTIAEKIIIEHGGRFTIRLNDGQTIARFEIPRHVERNEGHDINH